MSSELDSQTRRLGAWTRFRTWLIYGLGVPVLNVLDKLVARASLVGNPIIFENRTFPWAEELESQWTTIQSELRALLQQRVEVPAIQEIAHDLTHLSTDDGWKSFVFFVFGNRSELNCGKCPRTTRCLEQIPGLTSAIFSFLAAGKNIPHHRGEYKGLIRGHLGLIVPTDREKCRMNVSGEVVCWEQGKLVLFDNSYHHEVWNDTPETRVILMFDIVRPLRRPWSWLNRLVIYLIGKSPYVRSALKNQREWDARQVSPAP